MTADQAHRRTGHEVAAGVNGAGRPGYAEDEPRTGVSGDGWHAVIRPDPPRAGDSLTYGEAACGATVSVADRYGAFDPDRFPTRTCAACVWTVAIRTGTLPDRYRRLAEAEGAPGMAARVAAAVVATRSGLNPDYGLGHPYTVQLLAAVTAHAPAPLVSLECAEGGCEHPREQRCPTVAVVCLACSQRGGSWAGEREGEVMPECTITAPCEVLGALAAHFGVTGGAW